MGGGIEHGIVVPGAAMGKHRSPALPAAFAQPPAGEPRGHFMYCVPPIASLMGCLWLGEVPTLLGVTGGILALGGVAVVNLHRAGLAGR